MPSFQNESKLTHQENVSANQREGYELPEGARIERREDGSVWQVRPAINPIDEKTGKTKLGPDTLEFRVDSSKDLKYIQQGGTPWYYKFLDEPTPNAGRTDTLETQMASLLERVEASEARAAAAETRATEAEGKIEVPGPKPKPITLLKKKSAGKGSN